ncbi:cell growth regulator with EF hand domain protein 1 [Mastacembelus armatus]|uniref:Cell growth regulator with EF-hand domain 1 n=1 Tax=Mastacembelus armatus TaxID=205130 RepID=A0A3Q3N0X8_9TELE|nr:cell growth regulator with EF hand domain protein 1 [Mastacembelus armatus]
MNKRLMRHVNVTVLCESEGRRVPPPLRSAEHLAQAGRSGTEKLSRYEPVNANLPELKLFPTHTSTMKKGVFIESHLEKLAPCVLSLFLFIQLCMAAPGLPGTQREESANARHPSVALPNPFGTGEEDRRLLQSYIWSSLKDGQGGPDLITWEQEVFFLFHLYDYDRNGLLDGLEMMKLLSDYNAHHTPESQANELVVSLVDFLYQTQDLNQDGLLTPSELLSPQLLYKQVSENNNTSHQVEQVMAEENLSNPTIESEKQEAAEQREEAHEEIQSQEEEQMQLKVKTGEQEDFKQIDKQNEQFQEAPAVEQLQDHGVPVHQGQPEI